MKRILRSNSTSELSVKKTRYLSSFLLITGFILILLNRCITPFEPTITKYDNLLVVDGIITNLPYTTKVILSRTYPYDRRRNKIETKAIVRIVDNLGSETILKDNDDGIYLPDYSDFAGVIGRKYKLNVNTVNGDICESDFEEMKEPVEIGNVYYDFGETGSGLRQLQFYIDTNDPLSRSFYYSWDYEETWEFWVPYISMSAYLPENKICYNSVASRKILIESTKNYTSDKVIRFPLYSVTNTTNRLYIKYSVLVRQYVLNEKTYEFYKNLKNINENTGSLFDPTPVILTGNMVSTSTPGQPVLGNFQVSGASVKRIFVHRTDLPVDWMIPSEYEFCKADLLSKKYDRTRMDSLFRLGWVVMDTLFEPVEKDTLLGLVISRGCFDCTTKGKVQKPDFWDEK
jgi:hypothetical protein